MATTAPRDIPGALRRLRTIQLALLSSVGLYIYIGEMAQPAGAPKDALPMAAFAALAGLSIVFLGFVQSKMLGPAREVLRAQPGDAFAFARWQTSYIIALALCETFALYGLVLRLTGGSLARAVPFYACAVLAFVIFTPRRP